MSIAAAAGQRWDDLWSLGSFSTPADRFGRPFLPDLFGGAARQSVEAGFGADLAADPAAWQWTDITGPDLVQWETGVDITIGYRNEAPTFTPASFTCVIRNDQPNGGDFTLGNPLGRYWPYIRENTPIRARLDIGNGASVRFFGYATSWKPTRDADGVLSLVTLQANGYLRRLKQATSAKFSALRKSMEKAHPRAYWPLEQGAGATVAASAVSGVPDMTVTAGSVSFGSAGNDLPSSLPLAEFSAGGIAGQLTGIVPGWYGFMPPDEWRIEFVTKFRALQAGDFIAAFDWTTGGSVATWDLTAATAGEGGLLLQYINYDGSTAAFASNVGVDDGEWHHIRIDASQVFGNIAFTVKVDGTQILSDSFAGTMGGVTGVIVNPNVDPNEGVPAIGHIAVWVGSINSTEDTLAAFRGHAGETVAARMARVSADAGAMLEIVGEATDLMGPQRAGAYLDILQDAIAVDGGALVDGIGAGATYITRQYAYGRPASLTLDAGGGDIPGPISPDHDDQGRVNTYTARDPVSAGDRTFTQAAGDLGTATVGTYDDSGDHPVFGLDQLDDIAAWKVAQGTVGGLRYPSLNFQLAKPVTSSKAQQWLDTPPFARIDVLRLEPALPNPDRSLLLRGWREQWNSKTWTPAVYLTPYDAFGVSTLAGDSGDTDAFLGWLDTDGSTVAADVDAGAATIDVATPSGPVWTNPDTPVATYTDDVQGMYINVDGLRVAVISIAGATSPQTFTVDPADVLRPVPAGASVSAWDPVVIGL